MKVALRHEALGSMRTVKVGFSWPKLLFSGFFGIPCFLAGLTMWGCVFVGASVANMILLEVSFTAYVMFNTATLGLVIYMGFKGNELAGKNYLIKGYQFSEPESAAAQYARQAWGVPAGEGK